MMKKVWKNRSGVSPVIATILMVAITVVLAAVLYVMVMGFNNGGNQTPQVSLARQAGIQNETDDTLYDYRVYVASVTAGSVKLANVQVIISGTDATGATHMTAAGTNANLEAGDYVVVTCPLGTQVNVLLKDTATGSSLGQTSFTAA